MTQEKEILSEKDLENVFEGQFLNGIKDLAWRAKEGKLPDTPDNEMGMFRVLIHIDFPADRDIDLKMNSISNYKFHLSPYTKQEIETYKLAQEAQANEKIDQNSQESVEPQIHQTP